MCAFLYQRLLDHLSCCGSLIKGTGVRASRGTGSSGSVQVVSLPVLSSVIGRWTMRCWTRGAEEPGSSGGGRERRSRGGWPVCVWNLFVWLQGVQKQSMISNIAKWTWGIEYFDQFNTFTSKQKLQLALKSWSNSSLVLFGKGRKVWWTTLTNPCNNLKKSMQQLWQIHVKL